MHAVPGRVGLAAPQVGISLRVFVIGIPGEEDRALVNPEIIRRVGGTLCRRRLPQYTWLCWAD